MKHYLAAVLLLVGASSFAQKLDLSQEIILMSCKDHRMSSEKSETTVSYVPLHGKTNRATPPEVEIEINTKTKVIKITEKATGMVKYELPYSQAFQGEGASVSLKPGETLFMTKDKKVTMVNHNEISKVLHVMLDDNTSEMFELLELVVKK